MTKESWPKLTLGIEGGLTITEAPDTITLPLTWLNEHERSKGYIETKDDVISFLPTNADPVRYRVVSFDFTTKRFIGEKIHE